MSGFHGSLVLLEGFLCGRPSVLPSVEHLVLHLEQLQWMAGNDKCPIQAGISQGFPHNSPSRPRARVVWLVYGLIHSLSLETAQVYQNDTPR